MNSRQKRKSKYQFYRPTVTKEIRVYAPYELRANIIRRSYFFNKMIIKTGAAMVNLRRIPFKKRQSIQNQYSSLVILMRPNNTFISVRDPQNKKLYLINGGVAKLAGPKRSTPYSRHVIGRKMSKYLYYNGYKKLDMYFNSRITRKFYFLFKGLIRKSLKFVILYAIKW